MIIGLTGNIGSGKSIVAKRLAELGAEVIDADQVARDVVAPGSAVLAKIAAEFGKDVISLSGELDRPKMAAIAFNSPEARAKLEAITHPEITRRISEKVTEYRDGRGISPVLVIEAPLLFEAGYNKLADEVWVVTCNTENKVKRVMTRNDLSADEVLSRLKSQMSEQEMFKFAHRIIDNSGTIDAIYKGLDEIWQELTGRKPV